MRPARRVRRALPLPNSVRVSASRRKSATVCAPQEVDRSAHRRTGATHLEGRRTSITERTTTPSPGCGRGYAVAPSGGPEGSPRRDAERAEDAGTEAAPRGGRGER